MFSPVKSIDKKVFWAFQKKLSDDNPKITESIRLSIYLRDPEVGGLGPVALKYLRLREMFCSYSLCSGVFSPLIIRINQVKMY